MALVLFPNLSPLSKSDKGGIVRIKCVPGKKDLMGEIEPDIPADGGVGIGHNLNLV